MIKSSTAEITLVIARRDRVYQSIRLGHSVAEIARALEVSVSTIRRDMAAMPSLREESMRCPDAARWTP